MPSSADRDNWPDAEIAVLAKYWSLRLGKTKMKSLQSSKRTGFMEVELIDGKLRIKGEAVIVLEGQLTIQL